MAATAGLGNLKPTQDECTMATLAVALSIFGFIPPLVIFLIKRQSRFVSFHALQSLLWHIAYMAVVMVVMVGFFFVFFFAIITQAEAHRNAAPLPTAFLIFPLIWLAIAGGSIANLVLAVVYSIKAGQGEWADYPIFGRLARKILKIGPGGAMIFFPS
jgi:uncharacterized membrane protein